ncbi:uncharacterized protein ARMOST_12248 [Armillaria ostoyae]|uniref:Heterokaryon incompatibility domain-containing protein n=1 Tax=Armillaria ostoyae TaxID=47428 RepID=A0A284RJD3_ARMOS|nr:uncharacterized protein ARMOST_12248 [Armillaria ostoyae]
MVNERFNILRDGVKLALSCLRPTTVAAQSDKNTPTECSESLSVVSETSDNDPEPSPELEAQITYHLGTTLAKTKTLPEVTISAFTETDKNISSIAVLKQRTYTSTKIVICSSSDHIPYHYVVRPISSRSPTDPPLAVADTPCADLGVDGLLKGLNATLGTAYTLDADLSSLLKSFISEGDDFGTAYAHLRRRWYDNWNIRGDLNIHKNKDQEMRQKAVVGNQIVNPQVPPRRVWDLYSNRVVPHWIIPREHWSNIWAISHAWRDEEDRSEIWTPINGGEWPVPIPKDANLDLIRIEMLNLGAEYVWLDVLCLRRRGGLGDDLCEDEWKLDVRTVGNVYETAKRVVCYFSGLGLPFRFSMEDFASTRSWFRRAWLLQQINGSYIIGGDTVGGDQCLAILEEDVRTRFCEQLSALVHLYRSPVFDVLRHMEGRVSTHAVDRVAGLAYLLQSRKIPEYYEAKSPEDAWSMLVDTMDERHRAQLLFLYPEPGEGRKRWGPSWKQVMTENLPSMDGIQLYDKVDRDDKDADVYNGYCIEQGCVEGLHEKDPEGRLRRGKLIVKDLKGNSHTFDITAAHQQPIPEDSYTLIGSDPWSPKSAKSGGETSEQYWVVGKLIESGQKFEKVSVFQITNAGHVMGLLDESGIAQRSRNILI